MFMFMYNTIMYTDPPLKNVIKTEWPSQIWNLVFIFGIVLLVSMQTIIMATVGLVFSRLLEKFHSLLDSEL